MNSFVRKISKCSPRLSLPHFCVVNNFQIYVFNYRKEKNIQKTKAKAAVYQEAENVFTSRFNADASGSADDTSVDDGESSSDDEESDSEY